MDDVHLRTLVYRIRGIDHEQRKVPMFHQYDINNPAEEQDYQIQVLTKTMSEWWATPIRG